MDVRPAVSLFRPKALTPEDGMPKITCAPGAAPAGSLTVVWKLVTSLASRTVPNNCPRGVSHRILTVSPAG